MELWKDIEELDNDYQISNLGRIKSKARQVPFQYPGGMRYRNIKEKVLKLKIRIQKDGRIDCVEIILRGKCFLISRLVYKYFVDETEIKKGFVIAHKDKNPLSNIPENLIKVSWSDSRKIDHQNSKRTIDWQIERSNRGAKAMKRKALFKRIKFIAPK